MVSVAGNKLKEFSGKLQAYLFWFKVDRGMSFPPRQICQMADFRFVAQLAFAGKRLSSRQIRKSNQSQPIFISVNCLFGHRRKTPHLVTLGPFLSTGLCAQMVITVVHFIQIWNLGLPHTVWHNQVWNKTTRRREWSYRSADRVLWGEREREIERKRTDTKLTE